MSREFTDFLRVFAAFCVVMIHATAREVTEFHDTGQWFSLAGFGTMLNQLSRFSVPLFLFLSGFGLESSRRKSKNSAAFDFMVKRIPRIIFPYIAYALIVVFSRNGSFADRVSTLLSFATKYSPDYHLYFLKILFQCYILFPLLHRYPVGSLLCAMPFSFVMFYPGQIIFASITGNMPWHWPASVCIPWLPYFLLGILAARHRISIRNWQSVSLLFFSVLVLFFEFSYRSETARIQSGSTPGAYDHFHRYVVLFYACSVFLAFFSTAKAASFIRHSYIATISKFSFFIYLFHPTMLRFTSFVGLDFFIWKVLLSFFTSLYLGMMLDKLLVKKSWLRTMLGL